MRRTFSSEYLGKFERRVAHKLQYAMIIKGKEIKVYKTAAGKEPFHIWLDGLKDKLTRVRIRRRLDRIKEGNYGDMKPVGEGIFEIRLQFGPGYQIYFGEINNHIVLLLSGGDKSTQTKDIKLAQQYWDDFKNRVRL